MDDAFEAAGDALGMAAGAGDRRRWLRYGREVAHKIVARTAAGETLAGICRDPQMPAARVVRTWLAGRPDFAAAMKAARAVAGAPLRGRGTSYCEATAQAICARLCEGEAMRTVLADPAMPAYSTVYRWLRDQPDFARAVARAREMQGDRLAEEGWALAMEGTKETAYLTEVRLKHLRWYAAKLSPRKYGAHAPFEVDAEARDENGRRRLDVLYRHFEVEVGEDGVRRVVSWCPNPETGEAEREPDPPAAEPSGRYRPPVKTPVLPPPAPPAPPRGEDGGDGAEDDDYWRIDGSFRPGPEWL